MSQRDEILRSIQSAKTLTEQAQHVAALDNLDREQSRLHAQAASWDGASAIVEQTLRPVAVHERSTIQTDWLGEVTASTEDYAQQISAEAALWFGRTSPEVRADREEFREQAHGYMRRQASSYGDQANAAYAHGMSYLTFLRTQAASGLPQVQQLVDSFENPAATDLPQDTFDNFAPPVAPINEGVVGTETSERAPLLQQIEQEGGGGTTETHHDTTQQFDGPAPQQAVAGEYDASSSRFSMFTPTVAINHGFSMDDFARQASGCGCPGAEDGEHLGDCPIRTGGHDSMYGRDPYDEDDYYRHGSRKEARSTLPQIQQVVDNAENPAPTPLPTEVAFPWEIDEHDEGLDERSDKKASIDPAAYARRAAYVASLAAKDPRSLNANERQEILSFNASLTRVADQWSQSGPQSHGPGPANSPSTTPNPSAGASDGKADWEAGDHPTYADASSAVPGHVQQYSEGYGDQARQDPNPVGSGAPAGQMPPGAGGMNHGYETHAASLQTQAGQTCGYGGVEVGHQQVSTGANSGSTSKCPGCGSQAPVTMNSRNNHAFAAHDTSGRPTHASLASTSVLTFLASQGFTVEAAQMSCANCGRQDQSFNMTLRGNPSGDKPNAYCRNCVPVSANHGQSDSFSKAPVGRSAMQVSASFTSAVEHGDKDFAKGYKFASKWNPKRPLVMQGSASFEAGLYAGISDNPAHQQAWVAKHATTAKTHGPTYTQRIRLHESFTQKAASTLPGMSVQGAYLKQAATSTDLDTMGNGASPSPTGQTPINGPGTPPPLQGQGDPAAPGGPSPYNGAEPFGTPVAPMTPGGGVTRGTGPATVDTTVGGPVDQAAFQRLSPQTHAFRQRVAANRATVVPPFEGRTAAEQKYPVCRGCGEAFDSKEIAEEAHGRLGCGTLDDDNRGYDMKRESEAW